VVKVSNVVIQDVENDFRRAVEAIFQKIGKKQPVMKRRGHVYIKPNGVDFKPYSYTSPELLRAVIAFFYEKGADQVYVMENSTQGNMTRLVFECTGYKEVIDDVGARAVYLDEEPHTTVLLPTLGKEVKIPELIARRFTSEKRNSLYVSLPKLKTHPMTTVTLGIKNQMAFLSHTDRSRNHDESLHQVLADLYSLVKPDYTIIDGTHAVFHGHYPLQKFLDECIDRLDILIGGTNALHVDTVGAKVLGYDFEEVKHLSLAAETQDMSSILDSVKGDLSCFAKRYPYRTLDVFPDDIRVLKGATKLCPEGCELNVRMLVQLLYYDYGGKGGFTIVMGGGHDKEVLNTIDGPVLIVGDCAIEETKEYIGSTTGESNILLSPACNSLARSMSALCRLMGISPLDLVPSKWSALKALILGKIHRSKAEIPSII
jgi:uncharacterized protein (DUF362 family)